MFFKRLQDAVSWRWRMAKRKRYLRNAFVNGEELVQNYIAKLPCDQAVCRDGLVLRHPPGRIGLAGMILEVWLDEIYTRKFYQPRSGDTIIDAGANIGLFSLWIARHFPTCRVLAFEPFEENYRLLRDNLASASASAVQAFQVGLAGEAGFGVMVDGGNRSQDHRLKTVSSDLSGTSTISTCTLPDVLALADSNRIALFKCDIEGAEHDLFKRADPEQLRRILRYAIEYHDNIRPGTLAMLQDRLRATHEVVVRPAGLGYGMLYATSKDA